MTLHPQREYEKNLPDVHQNDTRPTKTQFVVLVEAGGVEPYW